MYDIVNGLLGFGSMGLVGLGGLFSGLLGDQKWKQEVAD
jgi:hypothetical protein